jgi:hypothetical protein
VRNGAGVDEDAGEDGEHGCHQTEFLRTSSECADTIYEAAQSRHSEPAAAAAAYHHLGGARAVRQNAHDALVLKDESDGWCRQSAGKVGPSVLQFIQSLATDG